MYSRRIKSAAKRTDASRKKSYSRRRRVSSDALAVAMARGATTIPPITSLARGMQYNMHRFMRWRDTRAPEEGVGPLTLSCNFGASGVNSLGLLFTLTQVSNFVELTSLYDQYRMDRIELWFDYNPDVVGTAASDLSVRLFPKLWIKRDYDDNAAPTLNQMEQSNQTQCLRFTADRTTIGPYYVKPAITNVVFQAGVGPVAAGVKHGQWLDTSTAGRDVSHFGVKMVAQGLPSVDLGAITIRVRYHLSFKNVR